MDKKTQQHIRYLLKTPGIYLSEHGTFLPGNIAKRGVIETISRKAISPLASQITLHDKHCIFFPCHPAFAIPWNDAFLYQSDPTKTPFIFSYRPKSTGKSPFTPREISRGRYRLFPGVDSTVPFEVNK